jgi:hypothetical protein
MIFNHAQAVIFLKGRLEFINRHRDDYQAIETWTTDYRKPFPAAAVLSGKTDAWLTRYSPKVEAADSWGVLGPERSNPLYGLNGSTSSRQRAEAVCRFLGIISKAPFPSAVAFFTFPSSYEKLMDLAHWFYANGHGRTLTKLF